MIKAIYAWTYDQMKRLHEICFFGIVGTTAAIVHFSLLWLLVTLFFWTPLTANLVAFSIAFQISYWGHRTFTFAAIAPFAKNTWPKLLLVQLLNLIANETLYGFFLSLHLPYLIAMLVTSMIFPVLTYMVSKYWVFQPVIAE